MIPFDEQVSGGKKQYAEATYAIAALVKQFTNIDLLAWADKNQDYERKLTRTIGAIEPLLKQALDRYNKATQDDLTYQELLQQFDRNTALRADIINQLNQFASNSSIRNTLMRALPRELTRPEKPTESPEQIKSEVDSLQADKDAAMQMRDVGDMARADSDYRSRVDNMYNKYFKEN